MAFLMRIRHKRGSSSVERAAGGQPPVSPGPSIAPSKDRRREARCRADRHQAVSAQLMGGVEVRLCNVSTHGVMFESTMRTLVGARVTLLLRTPARTIMIPGDVVRCEVSATRHGRLRYRTALSLASECAIANDEVAVSGRKVTVVEGGVIDAEVVQEVTVANEW
jgi:hypothetical protein